MNAVFHGISIAVIVSWGALVAVTWMTTPVWMALSTSILATFGVGWISAMLIATARQEGRAAFLAQFLKPTGEDQ